MKTVIVSTVFAVIAATTGAVSASANPASPYQGLPTWAQQVLTPSN